MADIELFTSSVCNRCQAAAGLVEQVLKAPGFEAVSWREVDVVTEIDHAVALGVLATPSIVIGGELLFSTLPGKQQLHHAIKKYLAGRADDD